MKIAYLTHEEMSRPNGVTNKINGQIMGWEKSNNKVILFSLKSSGQKCAIQNGEILTVCTSKKFPNKYLAMAKSISKLKSRLIDFKADIIYTRALLYAPGLINALRKSAPYVVEINSNDTSEMKTFSRIGHIYNMLTRNLFFKNASGFVCVSNELASINAFAKYNKPTLVLGNAIDTKKYTSLPSTAPVDGPIRFVFIGTPGHRWHGIEKIAFMAESFPDAHFTMIGLNTTELQAELNQSVPKNITALGYLDDHSSSEIIASSHIGIGTLSLHNIGLDETSSLKVRQYLALGLPVILGCYDPDLTNKDLPFILTLPNTPDNISQSIESIKGFVHKARHIEQQSIKDFATSTLDTSVKEQLRLDFLHQVMTDYSSTV